MASTPAADSYGDYDEKDVTPVVDHSLQSNTTSAGTSTSGKGSWKHAAFHVATTIATPATYAPLPFAVSSLGWPLGVQTSQAAGDRLMKKLKRPSLNEHEPELEPKITFIPGLSLYIHVGVEGNWGYWSIAFFQQVASLGNNIAIQIAAGSSLKVSQIVNNSTDTNTYTHPPLFFINIYRHVQAVYKYYNKDGSLTLQHFIIFFGIFELVLSQLPNIHSLRWLNAVCTLSTIGFAGTTIGVTIYNGKNIDRRNISYSLHGSSSSKTFKAFNGLGVIAFSFGDAMLPEIQSTVREPVKKTMYKGIGAAYTVILLSYWHLAFFGYWAFGIDVQPFILASLTTPGWTIVMANIFAVIQISGCYQIYCRPTYAYFEEKMTASKQTNRFALENHLLRLAFTSIYMGLITLVAAAMPFFGDFVSICGAIGFTPVDFVFPVLAHLKAGKMPKNSSPVVILNIVIATWFSAVAVMGCIGAVKFIIDDIKTYKFFHDM
ncbi:GABA transporter 1-like [Bidens hawaiensis]|uniref:GABA transporter 1-like n=1 Tax=Bidens hawaiensis TaxID=980011 RepID=UPI00404B2886